MAAPAPVCDVLVVGGGLAGLVTALECLQAGQRVTLVERDTRARLGGLALWAFGGMALVDTSDGVLMVGAYGWAFANPVRKLWYNLTIGFAMLMGRFLVIAPALAIAAVARSTVASMSSSSTSKTSVEPGLILGGAPRSP